jgi:hypothetical protein
MKIIENSRLLAMLLIVFFLTTPSAHAAGMKMLELQIKGDPGGKFSGDCRLIDRFGSEKRHRIKGQVPAQFFLPAEAVRCSFQKTDARKKLIASILKDGIVQVEQVSTFPFRWVSLVSDGPWGEARGLASASRPLWQ